MNMVDLMWLFCGALIGGWITLFFTAILNAVHENTEMEQAKRQIDALKRLLKQADDMNTKVCPICAERCTISALSFNRNTRKSGFSVLTVSTK